MQYEAFRYQHRYQKHNPITYFTHSLLICKEYMTQLGLKVKINALDSQVNH